MPITVKLFSVLVNGCETEWADGKERELSL
jgi:hypothetical protein